MTNQPAEPRQAVLAAGRRTLRILRAPGPRAGLVISLQLAVAMILVPAGAIAAGGPKRLSITTLSTRADLVTGGEALVSVQLPPKVTPRSVSIDLGARNVRSQFQVRGANQLEGLLTGLRIGANTLTVTVPGGEKAQLTITNHPISGPLFSGPRIEPWYCQPGATDRECDRPAIDALYYYSTNAAACQSTAGAQAPYVPRWSPGSNGTCFLPYGPSQPPASVPVVTTNQGMRVPFIVRLEKLWQDRDQVQVAVLYKPGSKLGPLATGKTPWNHSMEITQGSSCGSHHGEATPVVPPAILRDGVPSVLDPQALAAGDLVMSTALDNSNHDCNLVLQAESLVIAKEHVIDEYGPVSYTFGNGCSGGSLSQMQVANAYPGIYQGLVVSCTFPDPSTPTMDVYDCDLFSHYWSATGIPWSTSEQDAADGKESPAVCNSWLNQAVFYPVLQPTLETPSESRGGEIDTQNCGVPAQLAFDPVSNPRGVRCDLYDYMVNILGKSPTTGYANRPIGNVGVEYGLRALEAGTISPAQFVDLNAKIGSYNDNYQWQPSRAPIASAGLRNAYRSGFMNEADQLNQVAIIDTPKNVQDIHEPYRSFAIRARLDHAFGNHNNDIIWDTTQPTPDAFTVMTQWLSSVANDRRKITLARKIAIDKPPEARDMINIPYNESTREAAGGPLASDILGCRLEPLTRSSFPVSFTHAQWAQLEATFPTGVCNWNAPGAEQQQNLPWLTYAREPGGQPLGAAPQSTIVHAGRR